MLRWQAGPLEGDFILSGTWYEDVLKSTGYKKYDPGKACAPIDARYQPVLDEMQIFYDRLYSRKITLEEADKIVSGAELEPRPL